MNMKRISAALLALLLALSLTACGGSAPSADDGDVAELTAEELLAKANESMSDINSMTYTMLMDMEMSAMDETVAFLTDATCDFVADPMAMKMTINADMGEDYGSAAMVMYMVPEGDQFMVYMAEDDGDDVLDWDSYSVGSLEELGLDQYDAKGSMSLYMDTGANFEIARVDKVEGVEATRLDGVIPEADLAQVMEESGVMEQFASLGISNASFDGMGDLPISIWIANDGTFYPVRCELDMTAMMQSLMDTMVAELGGADSGVSIDIGKVFVSMTFYNFNELTSIDLPAEIAG